MSKTRVFFRPIPGTEVIEGNNRSVKVEKVLQGRKWWMLRWHNCYTKHEKSYGNSYSLIVSGKFFDDDEWIALLNDEKYVFILFGYVPVKL